MKKNAVKVRSTAKHIQHLLKVENYNKCEKCSTDRYIIYHKPEDPCPVGIKNILEEGIQPADPMMPSPDVIL